MTAMKKWMVIVILFLGIAVIVLSLSEIETIVLTIQHAHLQYFLLALLIQVVWFLVVGRMYQSIYHLLDLHESVLTLSRIAAAATFVNTVAPAAGVGGIALFVAEARRRGHPVGKMTVAAALFILLDQAAFLCILAVGLFVLFRRNDLSAGEITASLALVAIAITYAFVLYLGYRSEKRLGKLLAGMVRIVNRLARPLIHREYLNEERAYQFAHEISDGLSGLTEKPASLLKPILWGILSKNLLMGVLLCSFLSFEVPFSAGTIIAGFAITYLFFIVSPTPAGVGLVEGIMPLVLISLRVNYSQAVVITLAYRTVTFWVPFGIGAWAFRSLHVKEKSPAT
jgi:uncharacterized protein (TIRG00374 family)